MLVELQLLDIIFSIPLYYSSKESCLPFRNIILVQNLFTGLPIYKHQAGEGVQILNLKDLHKTELHRHT